MPGPPRGINLNITIFCLKTYLEGYGGRKGKERAPVGFHVYGRISKKFADSKLSNKKRNSRTWLFKIMRKKQVKSRWGGKKPRHVFNL